MHQNTPSCAPQNWKTASREEKESTKHETNQKRRARKIWRKYREDLERSPTRESPLCDLFAWRVCLLTAVEAAENSVLTLRIYSNGILKIFFFHHIV